MEDKMEGKMEDKTEDISGKTGKVWDRKNQCWCPAEIESRSESRTPGMWKVTCYPPPPAPGRIMKKVSRQNLRFGVEHMDSPEEICMNGGSYKKYKTKKRKTKKRKSKKRKSKKKNKNKNKTKRRR
jgi:hypothetical protein